MYLDLIKKKLIELILCYEIANLRFDDDVADFLNRAL